MRRVFLHHQLLSPRQQLYQPKSHATTAISAVAPTKARIGASRISSRPDVSPDRGEACVTEVDSRRGVGSSAVIELMATASVPRAGLYGQARRPMLHPGRFRNTGAGLTVGWNSL